MTNIEQIDKWLEGESVHNDERDECCPDFSCCQPELLADKDTRQLFSDAFKSNQSEIYEPLLMGFLGASLSLMSTEKVYIAGRGLPE